MYIAYSVRSYKRLPIPDKHVSRTKIQIHRLRRRGRLRLLHVRDANVDLVNRRILKFLPSQREGISVYVQTSDS